MIQSVSVSKAYEVIGAVRDGPLPFLHCSSWAMSLKRLPATLDSGPAACSRTAASSRFPNFPLHPASNHDIHYLGKYRWSAPEQSEGEAKVDRSPVESCDYELPPYSIFSISFVFMRLCIPGGGGHTPLQRQNSGSGFSAFSPRPIFVLCGPTEFRVSPVSRPQPAPAIGRLVVERLWAEMWESAFQAEYRLTSPGHLPTMGSCLKAFLPVREFVL
jgi:hypothetical protein